MAKTYNINTFGTLTNTDGVLSNFSTTNYATINKTITFDNSFELNFKVTTSSDVSNLQIICCPDVDQEGVRLDISGGKFGFLCGKNGTWFNLENFQGGTVQANTTYWIRASYNGNNAYKLEVSTDNSIYSTVISFTSTNKVTSNFTNYIIGIYSSFTLGVFNGSIDLNDSNININGIRTWRGVSVSGITIQLRRDTIANWTSVNPILAQGEVGLELDTGKIKIGDGSTAWNSLSYSLGSTALQANSTVIDGQWVENTIQLANGETLPDSTNIVYDLINLGCLPADATTYQYEIYLDCILYGSATSGEFSNLQVSAGVFSSRMCYVISRGAALRSSNSATLPVSTLAKLNVIGVANNKGTFSLWFKGYRRIGTNT